MSFIKYLALVIINGLALGIVVSAAGTEVLHCGNVPYLCLNVAGVAVITGILAVGVNALAFPEKPKDKVPEPEP